MRPALIVPPEAPALSDLISVDALGYDCIREEDIDRAFFATGKGVRLPRTCLPEPCAAALTEFELAGLIGRDPYQHEWDDYFSRYADFCRKEVVPFSQGPAAAADDPQDAVAFWAPLAARYPSDAPIRSALPGGGWGGTSYSGLPGAPDPGPLGSVPPAVPIDPKDETPPVRSEEPGEEIELPSVPLPAGMILLLTATLGLALHRRRCAAAT